MQTSIPIIEKHTQAVIHQFIFPFSIRRSAYTKIKRDLVHMNFIPFHLSNMKLENLFYGTENRVSHQEMEHMFLPFANQFLFPQNLDDPLVMQRYSRPMDMQCKLYFANSVIPFRILSADVLLCPYEIGIITIRTELDTTCSYSESIEFAKRFRALENMESADEYSYVESEQRIHPKMVTFFNEELVPGFFNWLEQDGDQSIAKLPFIINERMFTLSFYGLDTEDSITKTDLFRAVRLNGLNAQHVPYTATSNPDYLVKYVEKRIFDRWAPNTYFIADEHSLSCISNSPRTVQMTIINEMYGRYYYAFLLNLFHKIVLLKLSSHYGRLRLDRNHERVEDLIHGITLFSSRFYYREMVAESQLHYIFHLLRRLHGNDELLQDVKHTLSALYDYQSNSTVKRSNYTLRILTIFSVVSGIYGMNLVITDLVKPLSWQQIMNYSLFQQLALAVTFIGIAASIVLTITTLWGLAKDTVRNNRRP
ncbi:hypothetical protein [Paenibacillus marinisediminis]